MPTSSPAHEPLTAPDVTVVVLNWNGWADTIACVRSLHLLSEPKPRILVIDNHSSDDSVDRIKAAFPNVELIETPANLGFGGGCNVGIRRALARGSHYVWLINSDAVVEPTTLQCMLSMAEAHPRFGAVGSVILDMPPADSIQVWGGGKVNFWLGRSTPLKRPGDPQFISGASVLLRSEALNDVGLFDDSNFFMYWEDTDLGWRLRDATWQLGVAEQSRVWHHLSASLGKRSTVADEYFARSAARFFRKHTRWALVPTTALLASLLLKRLLHGHWDRVGAVVRGWRTA